MPGWRFIKQQTFPATNGKQIERCWHTNSGVEERSYHNIILCFFSPPRYAPESWTLFRPCPRVRDGPSHQPPTNDRWLCSGWLAGGLNDPLARDPSCYVCMKASVIGTLLGDTRHRDPSMHALPVEVVPHEPSAPYPGPGPVHMTLHMCAFGIALDRSGKRKLSNGSLSLSPLRTSSSSSSSSSTSGPDWRTHDTHTHFALASSILSRIPS